jgi:hypothetical protein
VPRYSLEKEASGLCVPHYSLDLRCPASYDYPSCCLGPPTSPPTHTYTRACTTHTPTPHHTAGPELVRRNERPTSAVHRERRQAPVGWGSARSLVQTGGSVNRPASSIFSYSSRYLRQRNGNFSRSFLLRYLVYSRMVPCISAATCCWCTPLWGLGCLIIRTCRHFPAGMLPAAVRKDMLPNPSESCSTPGMCVFFFGSLIT